MTLRLLDAGECALVVEFGAARDPASAARVLALDRALSAARLPGVVECVPTYRSLLVQYDPLVLPRADLVSAIAPLLDAGAPLPAPGRRWRLPACYDPAFAEDLAAVAAATGLAEAQVTALHAEPILAQPFEHERQAARAIEVRSVDDLEMQMRRPAAVFVGVADEPDGLTRLHRLACPHRGHRAA